MWEEALQNLVSQSGWTAHLSQRSIVIVALQGGNLTLPPPAPSQT